MSNFTDTLAKLGRRLLRRVASPFSVEGKMRSNAVNWIELASKVYHYRRDELAENQRLDLMQKREALRSLLRDGADASKLKLGIESLEGVLRRTGGKIYPRSTAQEYVEFFLVAAIIVLGVRAYFVQPFKIPTNSMWPTYNGMTPSVYPNPEQTPNGLAKIARLVLFGALHKEVVAADSGTILVPVLVDANGRLKYELKPGRKWGVIPAQVREYTFFTGDQTVHVQVPADFDFDWAFRDAFGYTWQEIADLARKSRRGDYNYRLIELPRRAVKGKPFMAFDILTGDQLFVDRVSYHFVRPKVGEGFVFRTKNIPGIGQDQYYIKRLVGVPGDKIEIREPVLYRNGSPITGAAAFDKNAKREGQYGGYRQYGLLESGSVAEVPADRFLALGDNSANSADGRYWGYVPSKDVVGRPLFIYYPFTRHWGVAP